MKMTTRWVCVLAAVVSIAFGAALVVQISAAQPGAKAADDDDLLVPLVPPPGLARWREVAAWEGTFRTVLHMDQGHGDGGTPAVDNTWNGTISIINSSDSTTVSPSTPMVKETIRKVLRDEITIVVDGGAVSGSVSYSLRESTNVHMEFDNHIQDGTVEEVTTATGADSRDTNVKIYVSEDGSYEIKYETPPVNGTWQKNQTITLTCKIPPPGCSPSSNSYHDSAEMNNLSGTRGVIEGTIARGTSPDVLAGEEVSGDAEYSTIIRWNLRRDEDVTLIVLPEKKYDSWRPEAGLNESTIGNEIRIDAKLQGSDGGAAKVKARKIIFELIDTSREPGVALNFPLAAPAPGDFDLQFSPTSNPPGQYVIGGTRNQRAETVPGQYTSASIMVSSFDWGAWSTLKVTAELTDGRLVIGHLRSKSGTTETLLPKRARDSKIADIWKQNAGVSLPDDDDSETGPAGDSSPGDGFSLYEEYRGFRVDSQHVAGDPKKIDFFVRNYIGPDAEHGIFIFADLTGAEVHSRLLDTEFDRQTRVMNANRDQGPHCDPQGAGSFEQTQGQHGVLIQTQAGLNGGKTFLSQVGTRGRPAIVLSINLQPYDSLTGMTTSENVPMSDQAFAFDRAVAHELLHSVGAEHHGEGDGEATFYFHYGDDPRNATGKPYFSFELQPEGTLTFGMTSLPGVGAALTIIDEVSGRDLASLMEGDQMLYRESMRPIWYLDMLKAATKRLADYPQDKIPWTAEQLAEIELDQMAASFGNSWYIGAEHGECSGDELCVMRYTFAKLYEKRDTDNAFYYISDRRTERAGLELCRSPAGTGINDKDRKPQPRYGDAAATRGACALSIIFNDALPLISDAIPKQQGPKP